MVRAKAIFKEAIDAGFYPNENPIKHKDTVFAFSTKRKFALTHDEEAAIVEAALQSGRRAHLAHWIACVVETGARVEEFLRLRKDDVFLHADPWLAQQFQGSVQAPCVVYTSHKGGTRLRAVPLSAYALPHFQVLLLDEGEKFWNHGRPRGSWETCCEMASKRFPRLKDAHLASLRHTFRTRIEQTEIAASPTSAGTLMGHSPEIAQKHYVNLDWQMANNSVQALRRRQQGGEVVSIITERSASRSDAKSWSRHSPRFSRSHFGLRPSVSASQVTGESFRNSHRCPG